MTGVQTCALPISNPAIDTGVFSGTQHHIGYWSSTIYADMVNGRYGNRVIFFEGIMDRPNMYTSPPPSGYVKAVRSVFPETGVLGFPKTGQTIVIHYPSVDDFDSGDDGAIQAGYPAGGLRFQDNGNGTVTDRSTGLIWQKANSAHQPVGPYSGRLSWDDAFNYVKEMNLRHVCGYSTWRLPNFQELLSLCDYSQFCPAVDPIFRDLMETGMHWTSTSRLLSSDWHWGIGISSGGWTFYPNDDLGYVIAVLGGPGQSPGPTVATPTLTPYGYHTPSPTHPGGQPTPSPPGPLPTPAKHLYYGLPITGQTTSYHSGDDGATQIGYPAEPPRWEDLGNGVLIDWATGLMWQQSSSYGQTYNGLSNLMNWENAFRYVTGMNQNRLGGFTDWRLPDCLELLTTRNLEYNFSGWSAFSDTINDMFWSSTCSADFSSGTTVFQMLYTPGQMSANPTSSLGVVRACRSFYKGISPPGFPKTGQTIIIHPASGYDRGDDGAAQAGFPITGPHFVDNGNGTVSDNATWLMWQKSNSPEGKLWEDAFQYVNDLNLQQFAGYSDWRLPNQMELFSIVDYGQYNPAINPIFTNTNNTFYWSSNTQAEASTAAWAVDFLSGGADVFPKALNLFFVRAVRGGVMPGLRPTPTPISYVFESGDYDGDQISDIAIFRISSSLWSIRGLTRVYFGSGIDIPTPGDYNGDGTSDIGIFRGGTGLWAIRGVTRTYFGSSSDTPIPGDYNGDGTCDTGIYRSGSGLWAIQGITRSYFGGSADKPVPGDYNGDGTRDISIFRRESGLWAMRSISRIYFGGSQDIAIPGNYDTTPGWNVGIFRSSSGL